jgi:predicted nucleic acid-binding protein
MELGNGFAGTPQRQAFASFVSHLRTFPDTIIVPASPELFQAALDLFARRADKEWSLTDCSSFVVMEQRGIEEALTADHHFTQAGYRVLLA